MEDKLYVRDLTDYDQKSERCFDLSLLPSEQLKEEFRAFILERCGRLKSRSLADEIPSFKTTCKFLCDCLGSINSLNDLDEDEVVSEYKKYLMKNGKKAIYKTKCITSENGKIHTAPAIRYLCRAMKFIKDEDSVFDMESDIWKLSDLEFCVRQNPIKLARSISFKQIAQPMIKKQVKEVIFFHLKEKAIGTISFELTSIKRFCRYLNSNFPEIISLDMLDRDYIEAYLLYINTEATERKDFSRDLISLKGILEDYALINEISDYTGVILSDDIARQREILYVAYSESELNRLNEHIVRLRPQIARALVIHEKIGTRISEVLTLKRDCIVTNKNGRKFIKIWQVKTRREYSKPIDEEVFKLIQKSIEYTTEKYGDTEYIFVRDSNPKLPMSYAQIQYHLTVMIREHNLRDDHGKLFRVGTHIFRHNYGRALTQMHKSDVLISKLLGHSGVGCVHAYRKMGASDISNETRDYRRQKDQMLRSIMKDWGD